MFENEWTKRIEALEAENINLKAEVVRKNCIISKLEAENRQKDRQLDMVIMVAQPK